MPVWKARRSRRIFAELGVRVHFLSFFDTSGPAALRIVASSHKDAGNTEDHDAVDNLSWGQ